MPTSDSTSAAVPAGRHRARAPVVCVLLLTAVGLPSAVAADGEPAADLQLATDPAPLPTDLRERTSFAGMIQRVAPSVVTIQAEKMPEGKSSLSESMKKDLFRFFRRKQPGQGVRKALGSGVIITDDGYVLTNNHVIKDAERIKVVLADRRRFSVSVVGTDARTDLAVLKVDTDEALPAAVIGAPETVRVGDLAFAFGNPFGVGQTVTRGMISAIGRGSLGITDYDDFIQTDAAINRGNSGGALVNLDGDVVGINTWITSETGASAGLGFAIPINNALRTVETLLSGEDIEYGWLGVSIQSVDQIQQRALELPDRRGALVNSVFGGSPADENDILPGDFLVAIDGDRVADSDELVLRVGELEVGTRPVFTLYRLGEEIEVQVRIEERESDATIRQQNRQLWPGMSVYPVTDDIAEDLGMTARNGVVVSGVDQGSPADIGGMMTYDVIREINGEPVEGPLDFYAIVADEETRDWEITVIRDGEETQLTVVR